jgi:hypothetical protein
MEYSREENMLARLVGTLDSFVHRLINQETRQIQTSFADVIQRISCHFIYILRILGIEKYLFEKYPGLFILWTCVLETFECSDIQKRAIGAHVEFYREQWKHVFLLDLSLGLLTVYFLKLLQHWVSTSDFEFISSFMEFVYRLYEKIRMNQYC